LGCPENRERNQGDYADYRYTPRHDSGEENRYMVDR
jgi:hypothetical protein